MRTYPFTHITGHRTYEITFLESVIIKLGFDGEKNDYVHFRDFISNEFGIEISAERYDVLGADPLRLSDSSKSLKIKFGRDTIQLVISGNSYRNFQETASSLMNSFSRYLCEIGSTTKQLSMEMIDVWPFQKNMTIDPEKVMPAFFSKGLISEMKSTSGELVSKEFKNDESGDTVVVKYGCIMQATDNPSQPSRLILDCIAIAQSPFEPQLLLDAATRLNDTLYDAFH